ncbi:MAG: hypothetical protein AAF725_27005, partial [Acidobacteriota bacterium]
EVLRIGFRKLGNARFKGLEAVPVFEVVDGVDWDPAGIQKIPPQPLLTACERLFNKTVSATREARQAAVTG